MSMDDIDALVNLLANTKINCELDIFEENEGGVDEICDMFASIKTEPKIAKYSFDTAVSEIQKLQIKGRVTRLSVAKAKLAKATNPFGDFTQPSRKCYKKKTSLLGRTRMVME